MTWALAHINEYTSEQYAEVWDTLSPCRRARIGRLKRRQDRQRSLLGELLARQLLMKMGHTRAQVCCTPEGKPTVQGAQVHISLSHSGEYAVCAVGERPCGIDIEKIRPIGAAVAQRVCTEQEAAYLWQDAPHNDPQGEQLVRFYEIWTAKEADYKRRGGGDFSSVDTLSLSRAYHRAGEYLICIVE